MIFANIISGRRESRGIKQQKEQEEEIASQPRSTLPFCFHYLLGVF
jgi:hypothetical protein